MARHREFNEDEVLDNLRDVFWEHGYDGASYSVIMKATGLRKGSLYAAFGDKRALYQKALARYDEKEVSDAVHMLRNEKLTKSLRIEILMTGPVDAAQTKQGRWGCLLCNAAVDQAPIDEETENTVKKSMDRLKAALFYLLNDDAKTDHVLATYFGARVMVKAGFGKEKMKNIRGQILATI